jgi:CRP/FNR family cyclic AMP-dependent transcriptional regulator
VVAWSDDREGPHDGELGLVSDAPARALHLAGGSLPALPPGSLTATQERLVRETPLLATASEDVADFLVREMRTTVLLKGETLYRAGDAGDRLFIMLGGCLQAFRTDRYGRSSTLELLTAGGIVGELSLVDRLPRTATVAALHDSELAVLAFDRLDGVLERHPRMAIELLRYFSGRLRRANEAVADMALLDVKARVAKTVLELAARFGQPGEEGIEVDHGLSQEDLARYVGASREMVNRALADLQARDVLRLRPGGVLILRRIDLEG